MVPRKYSFFTVKKKRKDSYFRECKWKGIGAVGKFRLHTCANLSQTHSLLESLIYLYTYETNLRNYGHSLSSSCHLIQYGPFFMYTKKSFIKIFWELKHTSRPLRSRKKYVGGQKFPNNKRQLLGWPQGSNIQKKQFSLQYHFYILGRGSSQKSQPPRGYQTDNGSSFKRWSLHTGLSSIWSGSWMVHKAKQSRGWLLAGLMLQSPLAEQALAVS